MNHEEMMDNAIRAAKNAAPLTCADGQELLVMIREVALIITNNVSASDDEVGAALNVLERADAMSVRLRKR